MGVLSLMGFKIRYEKNIVTFVFVNHAFVFFYAEQFQKKKEKPNFIEL